MLIPYYQAKVLIKIMQDRKENVTQGIKFFMEYLKLMRHYEKLTEPQLALFKVLKDKEDADIAAKAVPFMDREAKIAALKQKKQLENSIEVSYL